MIFITGKMMSKAGGELSGTFIPEKELEVLSTEELVKEFLA